MTSCDFSPPAPKNLKSRHSLQSHDGGCPLQGELLWPESHALHKNRVEPCPAQVPMSRIDARREGIHKVSVNLTKEEMTMRGTWFDWLKGCQKLPARAAAAVLWLIPILSLAPSP